MRTPAAILVTMVVITGLAAVQVVRAETTTVTFQQGVNGYSGCEDTYLDGRDAYVDRNFGGRNEVYTAGNINAPNGNKRQMLIRFTDIFGDGPNQVSTDVEIVSARLEAEVCYVSNSAQKATRLYRMLTDWVEGSSNNVVEAGASSASLRKYSDNPSGDDFWGDAGVAPDKLGPVASDDYPSTNGGDYWNHNDPNRVETVITSLGSTSWDITEFVKDWQDGTMPNYGVITFTVDQYTQAGFYSSEISNVDARPKLVIEYIPEPMTLTLLLPAGLVLLRRRWG